MTIFGIEHRIQLSGYRLMYKEGLERQQEETTFGIIKSITVAKKKRKTKQGSTRGKRI